MKTVSIILPVYNVEKYITKCITSIVNQTFKNFELIIVDDCGSDGSIAICWKLLKQTSINFQIIRNDRNIGVSESRKIGFRHSEAKFILFVDSDDWIDSSLLEKMSKTAITKKADIVSAAAVNYWEGDDTYTNVPNVSQGIYTSENYLQLFFKGVNNPEIWARLIKREILDDVNFPKKAIHEDMLMMPYIIEKAKTIVHIEEPLYFYLKRKSNTSITETKPKNIKGFLIHLDKIRNDFGSKESTIERPSLFFYYKHLLRITSSTTHFSNSYSEVINDIKLLRSCINNKNIYTLLHIVNFKQLFQLSLLKLNGYLFYSSYKLLYSRKRKSNLYS